MARRLRTLLAVLAVGALAGACSSGDDDASGEPTSSSRSAADDAEVLVDEPCGVLDPRDLSQVTGLEFDGATPSLNTCVYTSSKGQAAIAVNFRSLGSTTPERALQDTQDTCEAGTVQALDLPGSDGSFGCIVGGVPTVVATGGGIAAILTGSTLNEDVDPAQILQDLATILDHALRASVGSTAES